MANKYGRIEIDQAQSQSQTNSRKRCCIIATSFFLLVTITIAVVIVIQVRKNNEAKNNNNNASSGLNQDSLSLGKKAIAAACNTTTFPDVCIEELLQNPSALTANPRELVSITVQITLEHVDESYYLAINLSAQNGGSHNESLAIADCMELMDGAKGYLNESLGQLSALSLPSLKEELFNVLVWLSTTGSYGDACANGFSDFLTAESGARSNAMRQNQEKLSKVVIIAMGLVNTLSKLNTNLSSWKGAIPGLHFRRRRMLSMNGGNEVDNEGFPKWLKAVDRQMLASPAPSEAGADAVVSKDGNSQYKTIQEAVDKIPSGRSKRWIIYIKAGVYSEYVSVSKSQKDVTFLGDGMGKTIITGDRNVGLQGYTTFKSATVALAGDGFIAKGVTFQNTAGAIAHQAVALRASADLMVFYSCSFEGYQDTLYAHSSRQFYRDCDIYGTVDYIFGNAIAVFQGCRLLARKPMDNQKNTYTAQGRLDINDPSGYSFQSCSLMATSDLSSSSSIVYTYLGRPWKAYSRTVFIGSYIDKLLHPDGWLPWNNTNPFTNTLYYGEYKNTGPGSNITRRVQWGGVHSAMTSSQASIFAVSVFISPLTWLDSSGVAYNPNLPV